MFQCWFLSICICSIFANASLLFSGTQCRTKVCATLQIHRKASNLPQSPAELSVPVCAHHYLQKLWLMGWTDVWQRGYSETRQLDIQDGNSPHGNFSDGQVCTLSLKIAGVKGGRGIKQTNKTTKQPNTKKTLQESTSCTTPGPSKGNTSHQTTTFSLISLPLTGELSSNILSVPAACVYFPFVWTMRGYTLHQVLSL